MPINYNETTTMAIGSKHNICTAGTVTLNIDTHQINTVTSHKLLGLFIDETLSWNPHIDYLCTAISSRKTLLNNYHYNWAATRQKIVSEYDQEIPQSQTADNPMAPRGRATQLLRDSRKTTKHGNQLSLPHQDDCKN